MKWTKINNNLLNLVIGQKINRAILIILEIKLLINNQVIKKLYSIRIINSQFNRFQTFNKLLLIKCKVLKKNIWRLNIRLYLNRK